VKGERETAIRTLADKTALIANQRSGESSPVEEKNCLLLCCQPGLDRIRQWPGDQRDMFLFEVFLPHIDYADQWELPIVDPGVQGSEPIFSCPGVLIAFQGGGRAAQQNGASIDLRPHDSQVPRVIPRRFLLLVGGLMFFIDHDQPETLNRRKDRASGADRDPRSAAVKFVPFI